MKFILIDGEEIAVKEEDINSLEKLQSLVGGGEKEAYLQMLKGEYSDRAIAVWCDEDGGSSSNNWGSCVIHQKEKLCDRYTHLLGYVVITGITLDEDDSEQICSLTDEQIELIKQHTTLDKDYKY